MIHLNFRSKLWTISLSFLFKPYSLFLCCWRVAILGFIIGSVITLNLPNTQNVKLALAIFSLCILLFAYFSQFVHWQRLNTFWHIMLAILAGSFWAKDPNITAITETDVVNTDFLLHISAIALGFIFCLVVASWCYILFVQSKTSKKTTALRLLLSAIITFILIAPLLGDVLLILMKLQAIELTKVRLSFVAKSGNILSKNAKLLPPNAPPAKLSAMA